MVLLEGSRDIFAKVAERIRWKGTPEKNNPRIARHMATILYRRLRISPYCKDFTQILGIKIHDPLIIHWIKKLGVIVENASGNMAKGRKDSSARNERTLYLYSEKTDQISVWTAVDRNRLRFAGFEVGDWSSATLRKLYNKITKANDVELVCADENPSCTEVF
ncbi:MAG: hypothetical protein LBJ03_03620 [Holosporales bacterium]|jgi:hypothetical protein|nr:hypothetical protein [Holosporales bacterium]